MFKTNKVKFFLVAAALIGSTSLSRSMAHAETPDQDSTPTYGVDDDNLGPKEFASDKAVEAPYPADCHECRAAARANGPRGKLLEPPGIAIENKGQGQSTTQ